MITFADQYMKRFGDDMELEDYDIYEVVDFYAKMGDPDPEYMEEVRKKWEVKDVLSTL